MANEIKPEQVPDVVMVAFQRAWADLSTLSTKECLAAALNAWPGFHIGAKATIAPYIILPLPLTEKLDDKA